MEAQGLMDPLQTDVNHFGMHDFINDSNCEQFIDMIRGENEDPIVDYDPNYDTELMFGGGLSQSQFYPIPDDICSLISASSTDPNSVSNSIANSLAPLSGDIGIDDGNNDGDYTSTVNTPTGKTSNSMGATCDRSRTLVSERKRRSRMKDKLYSLRALVPNITKMNKASIIGDAVKYVQDLQTQAKRLKAEIAELEASFTGGGITHSFVQTPTNMSRFITTNHPSCKKIVQLEIFQVEEKEFYVRIVSNKGQGVATSLYKAIESLSSFDIQTSNFTTVSERFILTFTVNARDCGDDMNLSTLKLYVTSVFLNQGFEFNSF